MKLESQRGTRSHEVSSTAGLTEVVFHPNSRKEMLDVDVGFCFFFKILFI